MLDLIPIHLIFFKVLISWHGQHKLLQLFKSHLVLLVSLYKSKIIRCCTVNIVTLSLPIRNNISFNREIDCGNIMRGRDCILNFSADRNEVLWRNVFLSSTMINKMLGAHIMEPQVQCGKRPLANSPNSSVNFWWRVRSTLYSPVWQVTVVRRVGTWKRSPR
jgi:hypothetical protein